ncbi:MAG: TetR family transcriptional regulator [Chloroflexi bacterium]|nr:TetR family transcriptional regulator [Chloroflexota bacterium]
MPKGIPLSEDSIHEKRLAIAHAAAELIFQNGFNETSVSQIAQKTGIGKSTLYDYFASKDEIILLLLDEPLAEVRSRALEIAASEAPVIQRISRILEMHLEILMRNKAFIFKLSFEFQRLPIDVQARHEIKRQAYQDLLVKLIEEGIEEGTFCAVDPDMVMKTLLSILSSVILTSRPTGTSQEMLSRGIDLIMNGLIQR